MPFTPTLSWVMQYVVGVNELELADTQIEQAPSSSSTGRLSFSVATRDAFYRQVSSQLSSRLPDELAGFTARPMFNLMKVSYANERVHYEIAVDIHRKTIELALHFEDGPISTLAYLQYFDHHILELKHQLGHQIELERWTVSWGRIYELWPLEKLDHATADRVASRLAAYISLLQPMLDAAEIPPERSALPQQPHRDRWPRSASHS
jgi:hypothetical protein